MLLADVVKVKDPQNSIGVLVWSAKNHLVPPTEEVPIKIGMFAFDEIEMPVSWVKSLVVVAAMAAAVEPATASEKAFVLPSP